MGPISARSLPDWLELAQLATGEQAKDSCPPDIPAALLPWRADLLGPGLLAGAWIGGLAALAHQRRWRTLCAALFMPLATIGAGRLLLIAATGGEHIEPAALAADLLIWSSPVLVALPVWLRASPRLQLAR